jgi:hypothetical protein
LRIGHFDVRRRVMPDDLTTGLYVCPVCDEVFDLNGELPICETCLSLLERYSAEILEAEVSALVA